VSHMFSAALPSVPLLAPARGAARKVAGRTSRLVVSGLLLAFVFYVVLCLAVGAVLGLIGGSAPRAAIAKPRSRT
jgi:hypothetical protein